jgi:hypothetical protein
MTKYMFISFLFVLATVTGCSEFEKEMMIKKQYMEDYPFTICDENESLLICDSADLTNCHGYLKDKPIILEEDL